MSKDKKYYKKWIKTMLQVIMLQALLAGILSGCVHFPVEEERQGAGASVTEQPDETVRQPFAPELTVKTASEDYYDDSGRLAVRVEYDMISLNGQDMDAAAEAVSEWNDRDIGRLVKLGQQYTGYEEYGASFTSGVRCIRMDSSVISLEQQWYESGSERFYLGINFDAASGKRLILTDLLVEEEGFQREAIDIILEKLQDRLGEDFIEEYRTDAGRDLLYEYIGKGDRWYLDAVGIVFLFSPTDFGPYLTDYVTVTVPYESVAEYMKSKYCGIHGAGVAHFPVNETVRLDLSGEKYEEIAAVDKFSGTELLEWDTLMLEFVMDETEDFIGERVGDVSIIVNDRQERMEAFYHIDDAYLLCQVTGETYLVFDDENLDYHGCITYLFDITDGTIEKKEECGAWIINQNVNIRSLMLGEVVEVFGTYFTATQYRLRDESGRLVRSEARDIYEKIGRDALDVIRELPVVVDGEKSTLEPGARIAITAIGDDNIVYFTEVGTGVKGEIHYTTENDDGTGTVYVDGVEEAFYFEFLPYSG